MSYKQKKNGKKRRKEILLVNPHLRHNIKAMSDIICILIQNKVEKVLEDSQDLISSPSSSVKIQIIGGKVYLR